MLAFRTTFLVLSFVAACLSDLNVTVDGAIKYQETVNFTIPASNLYDFAHFTIHSSVDIVVCIQEKYSLPGGSQFSNSTCTIFHNLTKTADNTFNFDEALRNVDYHVGIYFASKAVTADNTTKVSVRVTGATCQPDFYYDEVGRGCVKSERKGLGSFTVPVAEGHENTLFYELIAPELLGHVEASVKKQETDGNAMAPSVLRLRYNAAPSSLNFDADDMLGTAKLVSPRPGLWVIGFQPHESGNFEITLSAEDCSATGKAGDGCNTPYQEAQSNMTLVAFPNEFAYWKFEVTPTLGLNVSVTTLDHKDLPYLLVLQGNIPTWENAQIFNCNQEFCDVVNSIRLTASHNATETWFIGVTASVSEGNTSYGIWFNETCAPDCETDNHGSCEIDGTCTCQLDFTGVDCATSTGLGAQYIVLIIIAALVVASAVIGFVAWAYMRRKRVNYELVS